MVVKVYKVYGQKTYELDDNGCWQWIQHRQAVSFHKSKFWSSSFGEFICYFNSDVTGTNLYTVVMICADSAEECLNILLGQLSDGIFENYNYGEVIDCDSGRDIGHD